MDGTQDDNNKHNMRDELVSRFVSPGGSHDHRGFSSFPSLYIYCDCCHLVSNFGSQRLSISFTTCIFHGPFCFPHVCNCILYLCFRLLQSCSANFWISEGLDVGSFLFTNPMQKQTIKQCEQTTSNEHRNEQASTKQIVRGTKKADGHLSTCPPYSQVCER